MAMVIGELIPMPEARPRTADSSIGMMDISPGGALQYAEKHPHVIAVVAAISPAIWPVSVPAAVAAEW
jgi:S-formylglutathione hydrolase FrmB